MRSLSKDIIGGLRRSPLEKGVEKLESFRIFTGCYANLESKYIPVLKAAPKIGLLWRERHRGTLHSPLESDVENSELFVEC